tara:strand:+ start:60 stop:473 length:414 start_codon:yes stop_codon:yes gene_type:complete
MYDRVDRYTADFLEKADDSIIYLLYEIILMDSQKNCIQRYHLCKSDSVYDELQPHMSDTWLGFYQHYGRLIEEMSYLSNVEIRKRIYLYKKERLDPTPRPKSDDDPNGPLYWEDYRYKPVQLRNEYTDGLFTSDVEL